MFSGLIQSRGVIIDQQNHGDAMTLVVDGGDDLARRLWGSEEPVKDSDKKLGASVAVDGTCLTVSAWHGRAMVFHLSPETLHRTTAVGWQKNKLVNLEPSLRLGDELGGHFVFGHVDGLGVVQGLEKSAAVWQLQIALPAPLMAMTAVKGSIAVDGCSLTINGRAGDTIAISLIPHTIANTIAEFYTIGQKVNIEIDMLMRYITAAIADNNETRKI